MTAGTVGGLVLVAGGLAALADAATRYVAPRRRDPPPLIGGPPAVAREFPVVDLGPTLRRPLPQLLAAAAAAALAAYVFTVARNVPMALGFAVIGWMAPGAVLQALRRQRRHLFDLQAYTAVNSLQFLLPLAPNVVAAIANTVDNVDPPLRTVLTAALAAETKRTGALTDAIKAAAADIGLPDFALFADILEQTRRQNVQAARLLSQLAEMWGQRLTAEQARAGRLAGSLRLGRIVLAAAALAQLGAPLVDPAIRPAVASVPGQIFGGVATGFLLAALSLYLRTLRRAHDTAA